MRRHDGRRQSAMQFPDIVQSSLNVISNHGIVAMQSPDVRAPPDSVEAVQSVFEGKTLCSERTEPSRGVISKVRRYFPTSGRLGASSDVPCAAG